jgi:hypothetical protein
MSTRVPIAGPHDGSAASASGMTTLLKQNSAAKARSFNINFSTNFSEVLRSSFHLMTPHEAFLDYLEPVDHQGTSWLRL